MKLCPLGRGYEERSGNGLLCGWGEVVGWNRPGTAFPCQGPKRGFEIPVRSLPCGRQRNYREACPDCPRFVAIAGLGQMIHGISACGA